MEEVLPAMLTLVLTQSKAMLTQLEALMEAEETGAAEGVNGGGAARTGGDADAAGGADGWAAAGGGADAAVEQTTVLTAVLLAELQAAMPTAEELTAELLTAEEQTAEL
jgi:hypothetical protein